MIEDIFNKFNDKFEDQKSSSLEINSIWYDELYNQEYKFSKFEQENILENKYKPHSLNDEKERNKILSTFKSKIQQLKSDIFSRQCVVTLNYDNNVNLNSCLSLFQIIFRNNKIDLHVHIRSQHFINNFLYDNQTFSLLVDMVSKTLKKDKGDIFVKIISLHKNI
jgi:thymidylate synthase